jgi:hypothetical protein
VNNSICYTPESAMDPIRRQSYARQKNFNSSLCAGQPTAEEASHFYTHKPLAAAAKVLLIKGGYAR